MKIHQMLHVQGTITKLYTVHVQIMGKNICYSLKLPEKGQFCHR
jgi:hypothetical protein